MSNKKEVTAIVLAAGRGSRMQTECPKQYLIVNGHPVIYYTLRAFEESDVNRVILVCGESDIAFCEKLVSSFSFHKVEKVVAGGAQRYDSVFAGLKEACGSEFVLIHDGARPYVTKEMINNMLKQVREKKACVAAVPVKDTIKVSDEKQCVADTPPRDRLWQIQTPQAFSYEAIMEAYTKAIEAQDSTLTDDAMVMERYGTLPVYLVKASYRNTKITTPEDLEIAQVFLK